jgi:hypothetical protein
MADDIFVSRDTELYRGELLVLSLKFSPGDLVILSQREYPIHLRQNPESWYCPEEDLMWYPGNIGVLLQVLYDADNDNGELYIKVGTGEGSGWTDWWNIEKC